MTDTLQTVSYLDKDEWNKPLCLIDEAMDVIRSIKAEHDAALERVKVLEAERDEAKRLLTISCNDGALRELRANDRRYRWLRDTGDATWRPFGIRTGYSAQQADAAIDAASMAGKGTTE